MPSPIVSRAAGVLLVALATATAGCERATASRGPSLAVQAVDQARIGPPPVPGVDGPFGVTQADAPGQPFAMSPPVVVTTGELMARRGTAAVRDRSAPTGITKIRPDRTNLAANPESRPVAQWPPSPFFRAGGPSAAFVAGAPNVDVGFIADTGFALPPDTMGDVGPTQYVVALNGRVRAISKATGAIDPAFDLDSDVFYGAAAQGSPTGDPRVRYDRRAGRWYILMFNIAVPNRYLLAVSDTSTIAAGTTWTIWFWDNTRTQGGGGSVPCLGDYPTLGVDEDALYVGVNQFCGTALNSLLFDSTSVYVLNRANLLGGAATITQFDAVLPNGSSAGPYTPQGVDNFDSGTNQGYIVGVDNASFGTLVLRRVSNPAGVPSLSGNVTLTVPSTIFPVTVPQPGAVQPLDGIDDRLMNAVIRNGTLWTVHQIGVNSSGAGVSGAGTRTAERWYQIGNLTGTPSLVQSGTVFDSAATNPVHHWMGSIMVNGQGHVALGASRGGAATFVNTEFTGRLAGATLGTMEAPTQYSTNAATLYNIQTSSKQRWGDYSYTSVDPNDDMTMWTLQEYPNASNSYAVRLIRLQAPPPAAIASVAPSSVATGQSAVNVTVTGTSSAGSGFFEPGASFANHLVAAFSGTGVTVTAIAVNSPTSLTLTLNTVGASTGARTLTVTNPDGQQTSLASALTITSGGSAPTAVNDSYSTPFNTPLVVFAPGVLGNDNANGGGTMSAVLVSGSANGAVNLSSNGSFTFTPTNGFTGQASFTYRAQTSGGGQGNVATVTIAVNPGLPTTVADSYATPYQTALNVPAPGVLANDLANGGTSMTAQVVASPSSGALSLNANGSFTYTPAAGFSGAVAFTYRAVTTAGPGTTATVTITVGQPVLPPPPTTNADTYATGYNLPLTVAAPGVLGNDATNGGTGMMAVLVANPGNGTVTLNTNGSFTYAPASGYSGTDSFTYTAVSNGGIGNVATVSITVAPPPGPAAPANFRIVRMQGNAVTFAWTIPTSGSTPTGFQLEGGVAPGTTLGTLPLGLTPSATVSLPTGSFYLRLRTIAGGQMSGPSNEIPAHVNVPVPPSAPGGLLGLVNGSALHLAWTPAFGGGAPTGARLDVSGALSGSLPLGPSEMFSYPALPPGTYTFTVRQTNAGGVSAPSNAVTLTFPGPCTAAPQPPANFLAYKSGGVLNLLWEPPTSGAAPSGYTLHVTGSFTGAVPMGASRSLSLPGPPGSYGFSVSASNACGAGPATATQTVTFP